MKSSVDAYESFALERVRREERLADEEAELREQARLDRVTYQIERAAAIAKKRTIKRYINADSISSRTDWITLGPGPKPGTIEQASLYRVDSVNHWLLRLDVMDVGIPVRKSLSCVQLHIRVASESGDVSGIYDYPVVFGNIEPLGPAIRYRDHDFEGNWSTVPAVEVDSPVWHDIDGVLQAFEKA